MRGRWRSLVSPDAVEPNASPNPGEAFGVWMLGVLWAIVCLWLGYLGSHWVVPGVLVAGLLALWGWRHIEWLWWFPAVLVVATLLEPISPLASRGLYGPLGYIDLLTVGVAVVAMARAVGLRLPLLPRTPVDGLVAAIVGVFVLSLCFNSASGHVVMDLKRFVARLVVFYATVTVASRPYGSRWVWIAFPLACAVIGVHAVVSEFHGPQAIPAYVAAANQVWRSNAGVLYALLVALPVSIGLSLNAGRLGARVAWMFSSLAGVVGFTLHWTRTGFAPGVWSTADRWTPIEMVRIAMACLALIALAWLAWKVRCGRKHESSRWIAVIATLVGFAVLLVVKPVFSGPAMPLLAVVAGLVVGTLRADRRAMRSGRQIRPGWQEAA